MMLQSHSRHGQRGFTLVELMIVVTIVALLATIALPSYRDSVRKANRTEGRAALTEVAAREEKYFSNNNTYTDDLSDLGYDGATFDTENGYYTIAVENGACGDTVNCFKLTATINGGQQDDTGCTELSLQDTGVKGAEDDGGADTTAACW